MPVCDPNKGLVLPLACRPMYLTQPPVTVAEVSVDRFGWPRSAVAYDKNGITLGLIADSSTQLFGQIATTDRLRYDKMVHEGKCKVVVQFSSPL